MSDSPENRILVVAPAWIGDMVMAQSLYKMLRRKSPDSEIDVLAPASTLSLVARMPEVTLGIGFKPGHGELNLSYRRGLGEKLKERRYRRAFVLPNSFKSALVPFFADIPVRTGFRGEFRYLVINDMRMPGKSRLPRMVDQFVSLGVPAGADLPEIEYPQLTADETNLAQCLETLSLDLSRPVLGICPGAEFGEAKKWPEQHFATLTSQAIVRGMQVWIFGGPNDVDTGRRISELAGPTGRDSIRNLAGKTSITDVIDLISHCNLVVSNDSGLMHIAAATGRSLIALFGSTSPAFTPPLSTKARVVSENLSCSPCFKRICPLGHKNCLNGLLPDRLIPLLDAQLNGASE